MFTGDSNLVNSMLQWVSMLMHEPCKDLEEAAKNKNLKNWFFVSILTSLECVHKIFK